jgi:predicted CXXCH cytochrome family protein
VTASGAPSRRSVVGGIAQLAVAALLPVCLATMPRAQTPEPARYVGGAVCAGCHAGEAALWQGSHHARAMQKATAATVLGDFANVKVQHAGVETVFGHDDTAFTVRTDGADGAEHDYKIAYTFGVDPLQQYLIEFPGGRYQALGIAWDSRPKDRGGQHWFHLYPDQIPKAADRLHWTGRDQTWNYQCANCHSTNLRKNYDLATNTYGTTWSDLDVSCEACHGPGSRHVTWAQAYAASGAAPADRGQAGLSDADQMGLVASLKPADGGRWEMNAETGIARRTEPLVSAELDVCAGCHSRRKAIVDDPVPGGRFLDAYLPALLEPGLYHADGQIDGEVYEYGSFLQSRMYHAGVVCSNCHDPHSATLRAEGNSLCAQCHMPAKFDVPAHHHHQPGSAGAQCANCHMPTKTYMIVDARRDHSIRVPRPDQSVSIGTPNACTACHTDHTADWAAHAVAGWFPNGRQTQPQFGAALHAGRTGGANAEQLLDALILDTAQPAIARASALLLLPRTQGTASGAAIDAAIADPDPLVRSAVARALSAALGPAPVQASLALLSDPIRAVRIEAARALTGIDPKAMTAAQQGAFAAAYQELVSAELVDADRPEAHLNLGLLDLRRRHLDEAEAEYQAALRLDPRFVPAMVNLADLDRARGQDQRGAELLRQAMAIEPNNGDIRHALGLLLVRQHDYAAALPLLQQATELAPDSARYAYVYAVALNSAGQSRQAIAVLQHAHQTHPTDWDLLSGLAMIARDAGDISTAQQAAREMLVLRPADPQARALSKGLEGWQTLPLRGPATR